MTAHSRNRYITLDAMRGIAALFVVARHFSGLRGAADPQFSFLAVDLFFLLSGFVLSFSYDERIAAGMSPAAFLMKRIIRLYPLYFLGIALGIAIALSEAGASKFASKRKNRSARARTERKEAQGRTAQQEREGKSRIGAKGRRESTRAEGGKNARHRTAAGKRAARVRVQGGETKAQLYKRAKKADIPNRSKMTKTQLKNALKR